MRYAFFAIATVFALLGIFDRAQGDAGIVDFAEHAIVAILLIYLSGLLNDWFILYHFNNNREVVQEKNIAVAVVEGATYLASSYVIAGAFYDWENRLMVGDHLVLHRSSAACPARIVVPRAFPKCGQNLAVGLSLGSFLLSFG